MVSLLKYQFDQFVVDGFDELGAFTMLIDGFPHDERYQPTIDLLEEIGYQRVDTSELGDGEYNIKTAGGYGTEASVKSFFCAFRMGKYLIQYQPINRCIFRGTCCKPHRPESDFRFADWYPVKGSSPRDYYEDERYEMGSSGLLKDFCPTKRQLSDSMSLAVSQFPSLGSLDE